MIQDPECLPPVLLMFPYGVDFLYSVAALLTEFAVFSVTTLVDFVLYSEY